jgi:DNA modification methylase
VFRAAGENENPVGHKPADFPVDRWQQWASPVWMDINQTNTLNVRIAKENKDEKHLCPLQLDLIERALVLWSNPGDVVLSPFMGIGSEGVVSLKLGRKFVGVELKESYWRQESCWRPPSDARSAPEPPPRRAPQVRASQYPLLRDAWL